MRRLVLISTLVLLAACAATVPRSTVYDVRLAECNHTAKTLRESIDCENAVRAQNGRPPRPYPTDAGADR